MSLGLTAAQVQQLAPDAASVAAGRKLGKPGPWQLLGHSERALWGECRGSAVYQTQVARLDLASRCTCPSRKLPCKHALGLLFLASESPAAVKRADEPPWVAEWLAKREEAQEKKQARAEAAASKPVDAVAQAKRAEKRQGNILGGAEQLDAWMSDLVRQGLARLASEPATFWDAMARRLVDAQAPGLASRVRRMGSLVGVGDDWATRVLDELGLTALLTHALQRLPELEPRLAADVRRLVGLTLEQPEVIAHGDLVTDEWTVLGDVVEEDERLRSQRAWLRGRESGRVALVVQFAAGAGRFSETLLAGTRMRARLAFWPSACPRRALVAERLSASEPAPEAPRGRDVSGALEAFADALGQLPWLDRELVVLEGVVPIARGAGHAVIDGAGRVLPLAAGAHDTLVALSGGHALTLAGEWDGSALAPLRAWSQGAGSQGTWSESVAVSLGRPE